MDQNQYTFDNYNADQYYMQVPVDGNIISPLPNPYCSTPSPEPFCHDEHYPISSQEHQHTYPSHLLQVPHIEPHSYCPETTYGNRFYPSPSPEPGYQQDAHLVDQPPPHHFIDHRQQNQKLQAPILHHKSSPTPKVRRGKQAPDHPKSHYRFPCLAQDCVWGYNKAYDMNRHFKRWHPELGLIEDEKVWYCLHQFGDRVCERSQWAAIPRPFGRKDECTKHMEFHCGIMRTPMARSSEYERLQAKLK